MKITTNRSQKELTTTHSEAKTYLVGIVERTIAYYVVHAEDARTAAENWPDGEFHSSDDEALDSEGACDVRERTANGAWRKVPRAEWDTDSTADADPDSKAYSVLLLYPDYLNDGGQETFYAFVTAPDALQAVAAAQRQAADAQTADIDDPTDFHPLLVTQGHHFGEPLFNK